MDQAKVRDTQMGLENGMLTGGLGWHGMVLREGEVADDSLRACKHCAKRLKRHLKELKYNLQGQKSRNRPAEDLKKNTKCFVAQQGESLPSMHGAINSDQHKPGLVVCTCHPRIQEAETGGYL